MSSKTKRPEQLGLFDDGPRGPIVFTVAKIVSSKLYSVMEFADPIYAANNCRHRARFGEEYCVLRGERGTNLYEQIAIFICWPDKPEGMWAVSYQLSDDLR